MIIQNHSKRETRCHEWNSTPSHRVVEGWKLILFTSLDYEIWSPLGWMIWQLWKIKEHGVPFCGTCNTSGCRLDMTWQILISERIAQLKVLKFSRSEPVKFLKKVLGLMRILELFVANNSRQQAYHFQNLRAGCVRQRFDRQVVVLHWRVKPLF